MPYTPPASCQLRYVAADEPGPPAGGSVLSGCTDQTTNGNNTTAAFGSPTFAAGATPSGAAAYAFNGTTQYYTFPVQASTAAFTVVAVVKATGDGCLMSASGTSMQIRYGESGANVLSSYDGANNPTSSPLDTALVAQGNAAQGQWIMLGYVVTGGTVTFWASLNGTKVNVGTGNFTIAQTAAFLASLQGGALFVNGQIAEVAYGNAAWNSTDLDAWFANAYAVYFATAPVADPFPAWLVNCRIFETYYEELTNIGA